MKIQRHTDIGLFSGEEKAKRKENGIAHRGSQGLKTNSWMSKIKVAAWSLTLNASDLVPKSRDISSVINAEHQTNPGPFSPLYHI